MIDGSNRFSPYYYVSNNFRVYRSTQILVIQVEHHTDSVDGQFVLPAPSRFMPHGTRQKRGAVVQVIGDRRVRKSSSCDLVNVVSSPIPDKAGFRKARRVKVLRVHRR